MLEGSLTQLWVGGRLSHSKGVLYWEDGRTEEVVRGAHPWADTGDRGDRGAQPDGDQHNRWAQLLFLLNFEYHFSFVTFSIL